MGKLFDGKLVFTQIPLLLKYLPVTMEPVSYTHLTLPTNSLV